MKTDAAWRKRGIAENRQVVLDFYEFGAHGDKEYVDTALVAAVFGPA